MLITQLGRRPACNKTPARPFATRAKQPSDLSPDLDLELLRDSVDHILTVFEFLGHKLSCGHVG